MINQTIINDLKSKPALTEKNLQIIACAGSGKTEFISHRIAYIIAKKIAKPENIVAFTFTEKAAEELKFRIRSKIKDLIGHQPDIGDIYVGTIHSFCYEFEPDSNLSKSFLIIAPNIIVFERLKEDFESGKIFQEWDLIPNEWKHDWQMTYILRGESRKTSTEGTLYLTNIHQLYAPRNNDNYDDPVNRLLG